MAEDLPNRLRPTTDDNLTLILRAVQDLTFRAGKSEQKFDDFAQRVDQRLDDTNSILQTVVTDIAYLKEGQRRLEQRVQGLEEGQKRLRSDLSAFRRDVDHQFMNLSGAVEERFREHDQRITRLETNANQTNSQT